MKSEHSTAQREMVVRDPRRAVLDELAGREEREVRAYGGETYYGMPPVKSSYYGWKTAVSFVSEGVGGISQLLAAVVDLTGHEEDRAIVRAGRYLALGGSAIAPAFFIADLHTPDRWYNMMRIFRRTSPMSIGSWSLVSFAAFNALTAGSQMLEDAGFPRAGRRLARIFQIPAVGFGGIVSFYAGTEIEETSLPLWGRSFPVLAPLFAAASASSAASAMILATHKAGLSPATRRRRENFSLLAGLVETFLAGRAVRNWKNGNGNSRHMPRFSSLPHLAGLSTVLRAVRVANGRLSRRFPILAPLLALGGDIFMRARILSAGNESSRRPEDYFSFTQPGTFPQEAETEFRVNGIKEATQRQKKNGALLSRRSSGSLWGMGLLLAGVAAVWVLSRKGERVG